MYELRRLIAYLKIDEQAFAEMLEKKTTADIQRDRKQLESNLQKAIVRNEEVARLYERVYEDNVNGKVTDEWFMQLSHKYEVERLELKAKIAELRTQLSELSTTEQNKDSFLAAVRKFMEMGTLTAPLLRELIDHIDVHETQGMGKNRTQRIVIYYRFIGYIEIPENIENYYKADTRQGVAVEYVTKSA